MARPRPLSQKRIKEIESAIHADAETFLRLKAELDAVSTGNHASDSVNPRFKEPSRAWETFVRQSKALNLFTVVYSKDLQ
jgi:hypothetical protein